MSDKNNNIPANPNQEPLGAQKETNNNKIDPVFGEPLSAEDLASMDHEARFDMDAFGLGDDEDDEPEVDMVTKEVTQNEINNVLEALAFEESSLDNEKNDIPAATSEPSDLDMHIPIFTNGDPADVYEAADDLHKTELADEFKSAPDAIFENENEEKDDSIADDAPVTEQLISAAPDSIYENSDVVDEADWANTALTNEILAAAKDKAVSEIKNDNESNIIVEYQRYLLMLRELEKEENADYFEAFIQRLLARDGIDGDFNASPESLANIDIEMATINIEAIKDSAPEIVKKVNDNINNYDAWGALIEAGYDLRGAQQGLKQGFLDDVQVMMAFDEAFPNSEIPSFIDRLKAAKYNVTKAMSSESGKLAMSSIAFSLAVGVGSGVALPLAAAVYATKLVENKHVQSLMTSVQDKVSNVMVKLGFKKENVEARKVTLGDRMKAISENKWFKRAKAPLAVCMLAVGVGSIASASGFGFNDVRELVSTTSEKASDLFGSIGDVSQEEFSSLASSISQAAESTWNSTNSFLVDSANNTTDYVSHIKMPSMSDIAAAKDSVLDSASELFGLNGVDGTLADAATNSVTIDNPDTGIITNSIPEFSSYTIENKVLWTVASEHYQSITGTAASPQQIVSMINDLGVPDPNNIKPGQVFEFTNNMDKYADVGKVTADWLQNPLDHIATAGASSSATEFLQNNGYVDIGRMYDPFSIVDGLSNATDVEQLASMNPDIDLNNLSPGDEILLSNNPLDVYVVPELEDAVARAVFPNGLPEFIDKDKLLDLIQSKNPDLDLDQGMFGVQSLFGNTQLGAELASHGIIHVPEIDLSTMNPEVTGNVMIGGSGHTIGELNRDIIRAAYPNGLPELADRSSILNAIKDANPQLDGIRPRESYALVINIPDIDFSSAASVAESTKEGVLASTVTESNLSASDRFMARFAEKESEFGI